ncbi:hypothetical protein CHM34_07305 [Paludifilum halophilum]|uniref:Uncharacterized protein n=1 Tax=Paludifilum halophilum TaxID=1642702 RepID=A0A235B6R2_9BACL|nr:hypothetical protein CHM34_07305 [Paludifilum halophilum]
MTDPMIYDTKIEIATPACSVRKSDGDRKRAAGSTTASLRHYRTDYFSRRPVLHFCRSVASYESEAMEVRARSVATGRDTLLLVGGAAFVFCNLQGSGKKAGQLLIQEHSDTDLHRLVLNK